MTSDGLVPDLNLAAFLKGTRMAGPGLRDVVWVQGCSLRCPDCANRAYQAHEPRVRMPVVRLLAHFRARRGKIDGVSVTGGEPTEQPRAVAALLRGVKALGLSTVVFTGYSYERLRREPACRELLAHTDLLIDGPFIAAQRDPALHWRGSRNQRLLRLSDRFTEEDFRQPPANGEIVLSPAGLVYHGTGADGVPFS